MLDLSVLQYCRLSGPVSPTHMGSIHQQGLSLYGDCNLHKSRWHTCLLSTTYSNLWSLHILRMRPRNMEASVMKILVNLRHITDTEAYTCLQVICVSTEATLNVLIPINSNNASFLVASERLQLQNWISNVYSKRCPMGISFQHWGGRRDYSKK